MSWDFLKAILILPGLALVYIPALLLWATQGTGWAARFPPDPAWLWLPALALLAVGLVLMVWTMRLFRRADDGGTIAPWQPIRRFIAEGPYRHVRNPMLVGVNLVLAAEALIFGSIPVLVWLLVFFVINTVYFARHEEPALERRYGETYRAYKRAVPRWLPRLTPYRG